MPSIERQEISAKYPLSYTPDAQPTPASARTFPGQDIRRPGMFDPLLKYPAGEDTVLEGFEFLKREHGVNLAVLAAKGADAKELRRTINTQPAVALWCMGYMATHRYDGDIRSRTDQERPAEYTTGISFGKLVAAGAAGYQSPLENLNTAAVRGRIMEEESDSTPSGMILLPGTNPTEVFRILGQPKYRGKIHLCLVLSEDEYVLGGLDSADPEHPDSGMPLEQLRQELKERKRDFNNVNTDREMHAGGVRQAALSWYKHVDRLKFRTPHSTYVGSQGPAYDEETVKDDLKYTFDHTDNNLIPDQFLDANRVRVISDIHPAGSRTRVWKRLYDAVDVAVGQMVEAAGEHRGELVVAATEAVIFTGSLALRKVLTRHDPRNPNRRNQ